MSNSFFHLLLSSNSLMHNLIQHCVNCIGNFSYLYAYKFNTSNSKWYRNDHHSSSDVKQFLNTLKSYGINYSITRVRVRNETNVVITVNRTEDTLFND